jgi:biopolymer transport protein ExbB
MLRRAGLVLAVICWMAALPAMTPSVAVAQEKAAAEEGVKRPERSRFIWVVESSGFIGFVIVCLSGYFVATVIKLFMKMKPEVAAPPAVIARCEELLAARDFKGIYEMVQQDDSFFSRVVAVGVTELPNGLADAREAMQRTGEAETAHMEKQISMLAVLGTLGPMIGLLGTLKGMIASFSVIALSGTQLKADQVAGGISEALLLTFEGVSLSVPAIFFFAIFRNRVTTITASVMLQADQILRHFSQAMRGGGKKAAAKGQEAAPAKTA